MASHQSSLDQRIEETTPTMLPLDEELQNAAVVAVVVEKNAIDAMHPRDREAHTFDKQEIRDIEDSLRMKLADTRNGGDDYMRLTHDELRAVYGGLVNIRLDNPDGFDSAKRRLMAEIEATLDA